MKTKQKHIYFLCPGIEWNKPTSGGMLYNYVLIDAIKKQYGSSAVTPVNLIGNVQGRSWVKLRIITNLKYLIFLLENKLGKSDLVLVDSRSNSLLLFPLLFLRCFSKSTIGMIVHHIYFGLSERQGLLGIFEKYCEKFFVLCAAFIITNSKSTKDGIVQLKGANESGKIPIRIVAPGLKSGKVLAEGGERIESSSSGFKLLYVGTCDDPRKGLDYLIRAIAGLSYSDFTLYLVGKYNETSSYHRHLIQCVEDLNLNKKVLFLGRVSDERLQQLYRESDIFVLPSLWEGYGIVLAEAMSQGLPVVATDVGAVSEIVRNGENGILVPPKNVELLTEALGKVMGNTRLCQQMASKSCEISKKFHSWDEVGLIFTQLIDRSFVD